jgi:hypothetical protein
MTAGGAGAEVSKRGAGMGLAMGVSGQRHRGGSGECSFGLDGISAHLAAASFEGGHLAAGGEAGGGTGGFGQTGDAAHVAAFVRDASVGKWLRHPHGAGFVGAQGCGDNTDLYACHAKAGIGGEKSAGYNLTSRQSQNFPCAKKLQEIPALAWAKPPDSGTVKRFLSIALHSTICPTGDRPDTLAHSPAMRSVATL